MNVQSPVDPRAPARVLERPFGIPESKQSETIQGDWGRAMIELIPKQTRKAVRKTVRQVLRRHGPELIAAVATGVVTTLLSAMAMGEEVGGKKKRKNKKKS